MNLLSNLTMFGVWLLVPYFLVQASSWDQSRAINWVSPVGW
jgi:hypothetical protein